jgi:hypothetical protein
LLKISNTSWFFGSTFVQLRIAQEQLGRLPKSLELGKKTSGLDAVLVQHLSGPVRTRGPSRCCLLRGQLWLLEDGSVMVDSDPQQAVAARDC